MCCDCDSDVSLLATAPVSRVVALLESSGGSFSDAPDAGRTFRDRPRRGMEVIAAAKGLREDANCPCAPRFAGGLLSADHFTEARRIRRANVLLCDRPDYFHGSAPPPGWNEPT